MFTAALYMETTKCLSIDDWIKMWCIYTMEYFSAIIKYEMLPFVATQRGLENIMLSEISQVEKVENHVFSLIHGI